MSAITPTISAENLPGQSLTAAQNGVVITTEWGGLPIIPVDLPDGFQCTIVNYSNYPYTSSVLSQPMILLTGTPYSDMVTSFTLQPGQSCVLNAASVLASAGGTNVVYFVSRGS